MARTGRPLRLDDVARKDPNGRERTVREVILERVGIGATLADACKAAGIARKTVLDWQRQAAVGFAKATRGERTTANERKLMEFLLALEQAEADAYQRDLAVIAGAAQGGHQVRRTVEKRDGSGNVTERVEQVETLGPDWKAAAWRLSHSSAAYRDKLDVNVTGEVGVVQGNGDEERAEAVARVLAELRRRREAGDQEEPEGGGG
jgi:hypothetical protein